ncbi:SGNH/GDSL hydrolase family protein [Nannocystaceae bacterium ST9]
MRRSNLRFPLALLSFWLPACGEDTSVGDDEVATETDTAADTTESSESGMDEVGDDSTSDTDTTDTTEGTTDTTETTGEDELPLPCLDEQFASGMSPGAKYGHLDIQIGSHCKGTNNQDITDIERVVFLGDSVTVGTPPSLPEDSYRAQLADELAMHFDLVAPNYLWKTPDPVNGVALVESSGNFSSCSEWGARTDDLLEGGMQIENCFPPEERLYRTLVVMTMGGNDMAAVAQDGLEGVAMDQLWMDVEKAIQYQRDAMHWFLDDPLKFPKGVFIVYANIYEFTDGTADLVSCPAAGLAGFDMNWQDPAELQLMANYANQSFAEIVEETQVDMTFMFETFCGRGFHADDPTSPCYRGPDQPTWFDLTCIHPTPEGHDAITDIFLSTITE